MILKKELAEIIGKKLKEKKKTIAVAESCSGGYLSYSIMSVSGASDYFKGGIICYSEEIKKKFLNIPEKIIERYTVVSSKVAELMALGIRMQMNTDYGISITGNAGPTTDNTYESIGVVFIGISSAIKTYSKKYKIEGERDKVIKESSIIALKNLLEEIKFVDK